MIVGGKIIQLNQGHGKECDGVVCETDAETALSAKQGASQELSPSFVAVLEFGSWLPGQAE